MTAQLLRFPEKREQEIDAGGHWTFDPETGVRYYVGPDEYWVVARDRALRERIKELEALALA